VISETVRPASARLVTTKWETAAAVSHFVVTKRAEAGRTVSEITPLEGAERVNELTRMLGGQSEAARRHAEDLLQRAQGGDSQP